MFFLNTDSSDAPQSPLFRRKPELNPAQFCRIRVDRQNVLPLSYILSATLVQNCQGTASATQMFTTTEPDKMRQCTHSHYQPGFPGPFRHTYDLPHSYFLEYKKFKIYKYQIVTNNFLQPSGRDWYTLWHLVPATDLTLSPDSDQAQVFRTTKRFTKKKL